jgi:hypothetical protein
MVYFDELTHIIRKLVVDEKEYQREKHNATTIFDPRFMHDGQHIRISMMVFVNPLVASLPQHDHLFAGDGCYKGPSLSNIDGGIPCLGADILPPKYEALLRCYKDAAKAKYLRKDMNDMYWTCVKNEKLAKT